MDKRIIWTDQVYRDIDSSADYIAKDSEYYAASFINAVLRAGKSLKTSAKRGRIVPEINDPDIREIFVKNHRLIYKIKEQSITILALVHGRRDLVTLWKKRSE